MIEQPDNEKPKNALTGDGNMTKERYCENCSNKVEGCNRWEFQAATTCDSYTKIPDDDGDKPKKDATGAIRVFDSGANRDTAEGKLSYVKIISPAALRRYAQYMMKHAKQSDGSMREPDNWKKGFPIDSYLDSLGRHFLAVWLLHDGFTETDNHGDVDLEDALCGLLFNSIGWLHVLMENKENQDK